ncbi:formin-like protein 5 [Triticum dicoccoides]|uniref:formin-like protein 5 n=1 Tax=Triticum dicoccoides TaxID=85692 RepID=UPI00188EBA68|nr:formin-like protein 5 [Triticum dicoccoides]
MAGHGRIEKQECQSSSSLSSDLGFLVVGSGGLMGSGPLDPALGRPRSSDQGGAPVAMNSGGSCGDNPSRLAPALACPPPTSISLSSFPAAARPPPSTPPAGSSPARAASSSPPAPPSPPPPCAREGETPPTPRSARRTTPTSRSRASSPRSCASPPASSTSASSGATTRSRPGQDRGRGGEASPPLDLDGVVACLHHRQPAAATRLAGRRLRCPAANTGAQQRLPPWRSRSHPAAHPSLEQPLPPSNAAARSCAGDPSRGTHTVVLQIDATAVLQFNEEARTLLLKKYKTIIHPGEVNRIREMTLSPWTRLVAPIWTSNSCCCRCRWTRHEPSRLLPPPTPLTWDEAAIVAFSLYEREDLEGRLLERDASFTRAALPNNTVVMY